MITQGGERMMKLWLRHIGTLLPVALLCLGLSSCIYDDGNMADEPGDGADLMVSFTLRMERNRSGREATDHTLAKVGSRADYDGSEYWGSITNPKDGDEFESSLLRDNFYMLLLEKAGKDRNKVVGKVVDMNVIVLDAEDTDTGKDYTIWRFFGILDTKLSPNDLARDDRYKAMIIANSGEQTIELGEKQTINAEMTFSHIGQPSDNFKAIPMWGVADAKLAGIKPGKSWNITGEQKTDGEYTPIWMLRAMAKIVVDVDDKEIGEGKNVEITSVTLKSEISNTNGYVFPGNWDGVDATIDLQIEKTLRPYESKGKLPELKIASDKKSVAFYVPEYDNTQGDEFILNVGYTVNGEAKAPGEIHIGKYEKGIYQDGSRWPIVRNHIYQYTITGVGPTKEDLRFKVTIADMEKGGDYVFDY